jgi:hypothetical protein
MASSARRVAVAVALAALLVFAGCTGGAGGDGAEATRTHTASDDAAEAEQTTQENGGSSQSELAAQSRLRVTTGEVRVEVEAFGAAQSELSSATTDLGGYVSDTSQQRHSEGNRTWTTGTVTIRVPSENFSRLLDRAKALGTVESVSTDTTDVTEKVVDLEARLDNLRAQRDRLRTLYDEANDTEAVLQVGQRLSEVQSEIERLEGKLQVLRDRVAYSTLTVHLAEPKPEEPERETRDDAWYDIGVVAAFLESAHGVVVTLRALAVAVAYAAPYALAFGTPVAVGLVAFRRWNGRGGGGFGSYGTWRDDGDDEE